MRSGLECELWKWWEGGSLRTWFRRSERFLWWTGDVVPNIEVCRKDGEEDGPNFRVRVSKIVFQKIVQELSYRKGSLWAIFWTFLPPTTTSPPPLTFLEQFAVNTGNDFPLHLFDLGRAVVILTQKMRQIDRKGIQNSHRSMQWAPSWWLILSSVFSDTLTGTHTSFPLTHLFGCRHIYIKKKKGNLLP